MYIYLTAVIVVVWSWTGEKSRTGRSLEHYGRDRGTGCKEIILLIKEVIEDFIFFLLHILGCCKLFLLPLIISHSGCSGGGNKGLSSFFIDVFILIVVANFRRYISNVKLFKSWFSASSYFSSSSDSLTKLDNVTINAS